MVKLCGALVVINISPCFPHWQLEKETLAFSTVASKVTTTTAAASGNQSTGVSGTINANSAKPVSTAVKVGVIQLNCQPHVFDAFDALMLLMVLML